MPWHVTRSRECPQSMPWAVVKDADGSVEGCHATEDSANKHLAALYANTSDERVRVRSMSGTLYRTFEPDLHVRSGGDGRTIFGIAVPYRRPVRIDDQLIEQFARGAFNHQLRAPGRVKLARDHMLLGGTLIGATTLLRDDAAGLYFEARASRTPVGDETVELVRDGALDQISIMFQERQNRKLPGAITERVTAHLGEIAVVVEGAYGELAMAAGVRSATRGETISPQRSSLLAQAEQYLQGLPDPTDHDLQIRALRLGLKLPAG